MSDAVIFAELIETIERIDGLQELQKERGEIPQRKAMIEVMVNDVILKLEKYKESING